MAFETIIVERHDHVAKITLNRPQRFNAINSTLSEELKQSLEELAGEEAIRVLIITGNPRIREKEGQQEIRHCFSAGWDLAEAAAVEPVVELVANYHKPVIAMVNGIALGGGCELALACDFIISAETSEFGLPEINRGLLPGWGGTQRLPRRVGAAKALWLMLSGEPVSGSEAKDIGLVDQVVSRENLDQAVSAFAAKLASKPPLGLKQIKEVVRRGIELPLAEGLKLEQEALANLLQTEDFREGLAAFMEKREPQWKGR